ncbi:cell division protein ZapB [Pseudomonas aeruginosa]|uniref:cell division protein ZapB n=1 Tax=Pseudomonas aeruginosa TaxID=287 RepID=UPI001293D566|nr:cell division protein ZapB [Pseudomonas aeruginosa]QFZ03465.1 hypothetical protein CPZ93_33470 [Pseudomonas aeruginosa]
MNKPRKKKGQHLEREEDPEFLALVAGLPDDVEAMHARAGVVRAIYNDAVIAADDSARRCAALEHDAIVFKLNGCTFFGCRGDDSRPGRVLDAMFAAEPGQVPHWGQGGEFLVEVDGVRVLVKYDCEGLRSAPGFDATAVDFDKPFISSTGYRSVYMTVGDHLGRSLEQAVRAEISAQIEAKGLRPITKEDLRWIKKRPQWLAEALDGVTRDGQLVMFGDSPAPRKPLSGAERQKRRREKLKKLRELEGLKPYNLDLVERRHLLEACDFWFAFRGCALDLSEAPKVAALYERLFADLPEFDAAAIGRSQDAKVLRDQWQEELRRRLADFKEQYALAQHFRAEAERLRDGAESPAPLVLADLHYLWQAVDALETLRIDQGMLDNVEIRERLGRVFGSTPWFARDGLGQLGHSPDVYVVLDYQKKEAARAFDTAAQLRRQLDELKAQRAKLAERLRGLERENAQVVAERGKAFRAVEVLQARLKFHGIDGDYHESDEGRRRVTGIAD